MNDAPDDVVEEPKPAAQAEAEGDATVTVKFGEESYTIPAAIEDMSGDVLDAIDDQAASHFLKAVLEPDQWKRFKATKPKVRDYEALFNEFAKALGLVKAGE